MSVDIDALLQIMTTILILQKKKLLKFYETSEVLTCTIENHLKRMHQTGFFSAFGKRFLVFISPRVRTYDQNFVPLIICYKIATLSKINVPSIQMNVPPCQINDPPSQINIPHCQINVPLSNKFPKFLRQNHDPGDIYLQEGLTFVFLFDHVYGALTTHEMAMQLPLQKQEIQTKAKTSFWRPSFYIQKQMGNLSQFFAGFNLTTKSVKFKNRAISRNCLTLYFL